MKTSPEMVRFFDLLIFFRGMARIGRRPFETVTQDQEIAAAEKQS